MDLRSRLNYDLGRLYLFLQTSLLTTSRQKIDLYKVLSDCRVMSSKPFSNQLHFYSISIKVKIFVFYMFNIL